nr:hypothetical protein [Tanacetum cinerariifolium]
MTLPNPQRHVVPTTILTKSKLVPIPAARLVTAAGPKTHVTRPRPVKTVVTKPYSPPRRHINRSLSPKASTFPPKVTTAKAPMGNPQHALKDKGVIDSRCSRHMIGNMSYLSDFKELNGGYVAFGGNPKGELKFNLFSVSQMCDKKNIVLFTDTECLVLSLEFKQPNENQVLLRVLRENNMYNVDLKNIIPSGDLTCLFAKATLDESNLWHRRLNRVLMTKPQNKTPYELLLGRTPSIGFMRPFGCPVTILNTLDPLVKFNGKVDEGVLVGYSVSSSGPTWLFDIDTLTKTMKYQPVTAINQSNLSAGAQEQFNAEKAGEESAQQYVFFPLWSSGSTNPQNTDDDTAFGGKKHEFEGRKPESEVHISPRSKFEDLSNNSINEVNAADSLVLTVGQISTNNTNTFSAAELEDITYSDDEEDVGAEADFTNLETTITVSHIPTIRVHKDYHVTQIISDLSSATQTRSMTWVAKDHDGLSQINNDDFHRCMFACFLSQEEPKREEGIDYEEVFAPVARIEAIRLFLAYASFIGFVVYQMDVKSAFLYGTIEEGVYVCQPPGFEDHDYLDKVYKVVKALYGLHQAPRAWYETLANYLLENGFQRGKIDQTLFIKRQKGDILLVQIYVDDIFLVLLIKTYNPDGIFISHDKYVAKILRKFGLTDEKSASTPIDTEKLLLKDPDVKKIFRYLKGKPHLGLWYPKDLPFNLVAYSDSDYAGASLDRKSTTRDVNSLDAD